jgi:hypothetical protein
MSKWTKAAVVAIANEVEFCWIETRQKATSADFYFTA